MDTGSRMKKSQVWARNRICFLSVCRRPPTCKLIPGSDGRLQLQSDHSRYSTHQGDGTTTQQGIALLHTRPHNTRDTVQQHNRKRHYSTQVHTTPGRWQNNTTGDGTTLHKSTHQGAGRTTQQEKALLHTRQHNTRDTAQHNGKLQWGLFKSIQFMLKLDVMFIHLSSCLFNHIQNR